MNKKDDLVFVEHILDSINAIEDFSKGISREEITSNRLKQSAIVREIEIIGEAVKNIPDYFRNQYPDIPWRDIAGMRDVIIHGYFKVDLETIWKVIDEDLPELKEKISKIKERMWFVWLNL